MEEKEKNNKDVYLILIQYNAELLRPNVSPWDFFGLFQNNVKVWN